MSNATEQARSTRGDARAFADAFSAADDAFTSGSSAGESRTLTLDELGDVLSSSGVAPAPVRAPRAVPEAGAAPDEDALLTLDELSDALARPAVRAAADELDFDFGTSAHERARRRTAARFDGSTTARRRISGPSREPAPGAPGTATSRVPSAHGRTVHVVDTSPAARAAVAEAAATTAERLAAPRDRSGSLRPGGAPVPLELEPSDPRLATSGGRRVAGRSGRGGPVAQAPSLRDVDRRERSGPTAMERLAANPDRIALWAVLLGIVLVLIAISSGSAGAVALPLISAL